LGFVYFPLTGLLDVAVTIDTFTSPLGNLPGLRPLRLAPHGPLGNFLPLYLSDESACGKNEPANGRVLEILCNKLEPSASLLRLVEQNTDMVLVPG
jgi:hypothetical protein